MARPGRLLAVSAACTLLLGLACAQSGGSKGGSTSSSGGGSGSGANSSGGSGKSGGTCAALPAPPDAFFTGLTRMKPDRSWTWNPWDSVPKVKDSAERFTCTDFEFIHPGTIASAEQTRALALVRARGPKIARAVVDSLAAWADSDLPVPPRAKAVVFVAYNPSSWDVTPDMVDAWEELKGEAKAAANAGAVGHEFSDVDGRRALNHTFAWLATGRDKYADKAVQIIDAWASTTRSFGPRYANGALESGWGTALYARAAELLKSMGAKAWTRAVERRFFAFVDTLLLPNLRYYDDNPLAYTSGNEAGSNWAGSILEARLQYAILREDVGAFEDAARRAVKWVGTYVLPDGTTDETVNRDFMHGQFGIAGMVGVASLLYHQTRGALDLFDYRSPLQAGMELPPIAAALELHAATLLGSPPPALAGVKLNAIRSPPNRNDFKDANFEAGLSHYTRVKKRALPNTAALLAKWRPESLILHWGMGTATHYGPDCILAPSDACKDA